MSVLDLAGRIWRRSFIVRYANAARLLCRGVRAHPSVLVEGPLGSVSNGGRASIGARTVLRLGHGASIHFGEGTWVASDVEMEATGRICIGRGTTIQRRATVNGSVTIGAECILAPNVFISSGTHPFRTAPSLSIREQERRIARGELPPDEAGDRPVVVGDDCWLGVNVVVCPGVTIGDGCVIGANAVVTRSIPPYTVAAGAPARRIGGRRDDRDSTD